jgi:hypothetical protein
MATSQGSTAPSHLLFDVEAIKCSMCARIEHVMETGRDEGIVELHGLHHLVDFPPSLLPLPLDLLPAPDLGLVVLGHIHFLWRRLVVVVDGGTMRFCNRGGGGTIRPGPLLGPRGT